MVGRRRSDRGKVSGSFFWSDGRTEITWSDGRTADGGRRTDGSFYFALEPPPFVPQVSLICPLIRSFFATWLDFVKFW